MSRYVAGAVRGAGIGLLFLAFDVTGWRWFVAFVGVLLILEGHTACVKQREKAKS